jgi:HK97 family phage prohead protease
MKIQRMMALDYQPTIAENRMSGHASVFDRLAPIGAKYERIAPHAFDNALKRGDDVRFLLNHNADNLLGRTASGTLQLRTDDTGLHIESDLPDTTLGRDVRELIKRGDLTGMSFGFAPNKSTDSFDLAPDGKQVRTVNDLKLFDVSLATFPAYKEANDIVLRCIDFTHSLSNRERLIRARAVGYNPKKGK